MTTHEIETVYEAIALGIDAAGPQKAELFLAKLALLLARDTGDVEKTRTRIAEASKNLTL
ncbi:MAG: hypothetical protein ACI8R4_000717 [Paracoccaceae bacterium]|jgi:hypothetical protein